MPVPRARREDDRVEYVIVRRAGVDVDEEVDEFEAPFNPTATVDQIIEPSNARRQAPPAPTETDYESDDDDDDLPSPTQGGTPSPILITTTLPQAQATGGALEDNSPVETVVVSLSPPPPPPRPPQGGKGGGISQTTEHLLIAAGSIGATIIVVMIVLAIYTMRKRGMTLAEAIKHGKYQVTRRGPPPPPPKRTQSSWDSKQAFNSEYGAMRNNTVTPPQPAAMARSGSMSSQRPLMALERSDSYRTQIVERNGSSNTVPQSFLLDSPPSRKNSNRSHQRTDSGTPSSPVLPVQSQRQSASTHNTRSMLDEEGSAQQFPELPQERALSPLPPPPTFKQFLSNRPSISGRPGFGGAPGGAMVSRFSWTNSNAPQTPHDPYRDTNSHTIGRDSFMTQRSSIPRFRTIDSWVNQQTNRLEEQKLKEQFRLTQTSTVYSGEGDSDIPEVPDLPKNVDELRETPTNSAIQAQKGTPQPQASPRTPPSGGLPGKNIKHERHDTRTTVETAPIFRQHPGTEVRFSKRSAVPSEILDMGMKNTVLS